MVGGASEPCSVGVHAGRIVTVAPSDADLQATETVDLSDESRNTGEAAGDHLIQIQSVLGSAHNDTLVGADGTNTLTGGAGNDSLTGSAGNDRLDGGAGTDAMIGGAGSDTYTVDSAGDVVDETGGDGVDLVQSSISFSLSDGSHAIGAVENLTLLLTSSINATGNDLKKWGVVIRDAGISLDT